MDFKDYSIVAWNVRGSINKNSRAHIRSLVRRLRPSLMIVLETHAVFDKSKAFWSKLGFEVFGLVEVQGYSGGI